MSQVIKITDANFETEVLASSTPVLLDFGAAWCGPCKQLEPVVEDIAAEFSGRLKVVSVDIEEAPDTAVRFGILSVPTLLLLRDGQVSGQSTGFMPKARLADWLSRSL